MRRGDDADPGLGAADVHAETEVAHVDVPCTQLFLAPLTVEGPYLDPGMARFSANASGTAARSSRPATG